MFQPAAYHPNPTLWRSDNKRTTPFIAVRKFGRILLEAPTIYLALPLVCAHWAIVRGWPESHYLTSFGLMPAGAVFADGGFAQV
jgi:hypothetical protein